MPDNQPTKPVSIGSLHELDGGTLTPGAQEALRWLWNLEIPMLVRDARACIDDRWGEAVSAELKAFFSGSSIQ